MIFNINLETYKKLISTLAISNSILQQPIDYKAGLTKAISLGVKNDTDGLGAKSGEWGFAWWDHVFNKTSASIQINSDEGEVTVQKASQAEQRQEEKKLLYGSFVKSENKSEKSDLDKDYSIKVSDKDLLLACEGRTARKGARIYQPEKPQVQHNTLTTELEKQNQDASNGCKSIDLIKEPTDTITTSSKKSKSKRSKADRQDDKKKSKTAHSSKLKRSQADLNLDDPPKKSKKTKKQKSEP
ncbi:hypothetical protein BATDEDRAFT_28584 [Batrachochytrium dendrobatidis JAM81]|uniref:G-patch domain-containing protein n=1 Tax=Batrachochytrium dendrobatidis (strain JAM81 / FGSC 10211) TaxID=684364 RepID=F4PEH8_BATDJ|nr:uncharacterized protein BATDEDRAFT_28584 [Batrachochytrium dendrobatidis JAM81]EGF76429.1 hypothetical protein BATDEDRAFT_28584 [Batrachochytrium dendrobatidis JAM81]|eukprot:XP_006682973.1 hypothetical protein BATDEDRAFT_28584 [Batrachochytrium dendrobatidis JAM81]